ncbi:uroporphyrinogen-III synthase [Peribacillus saganii]|uniref:Uroporphyrinogen-III synthase n=1 Tax=Peribacillus saganii TaxID=2303992 RepID=A0A372LUG7_9BACI|nr:uroporphyrinogen-III synthase [Peribacillus saganii]RFU71557.1 uroporphyrinogen-III synthase [Peribacillus saganii]
MDCNKPLLGKRVLITRAIEQSSAMIERITELGGVPLAIPLLDFALPDHIDEIKEKFYELHEFDWLVFTSKNGVDFFFKALKQTEYRGSIPRIAVIGDKTCDALLKYGLKPDFIPREFVAEAFIQEFLPVIRKKAKLLAVKGNLSRDIITASLTQAGFFCEDMIIYRTVLPEGSKAKLVTLLRNCEADVVTFTSSSTVEHFMSIVNQYNLADEISRLLYACIGPIARKTAEKYGISVKVCPEVYTAEAMIEALACYLADSV